MSTSKSINIYFIDTTSWMRGPVTPLWNHQSGSISAGQQGSRGGKQWADPQLLACTLIVHTCTVLYCTPVMQYTVHGVTGSLYSPVCTPGLLHASLIGSCPDHQGDISQEILNVQKNHSIILISFNWFIGFKGWYYEQTFEVLCPLLPREYRPSHLRLPGLFQDQTPGQAPDTEASGQPQPIMCTRDPTPDIGPELPCVTQSVLRTLESDIFLELRQWLDIERGDYWCSSIPEAWVIPVIANNARMSPGLYFWWLWHRW